MSDPRESNPAASQFLQSAIASRAEAIWTLRQLLGEVEHGEDAVQESVADLFRRAGADVDVLTFEPASVELAGEFVHPEQIDTGTRRVVLGRIPGRCAGPGLMIWAHPDGLAFDGASEWSRDPFAGEVDGDRMYGWSVADDLSGVAALVMVAKLINEAGVQPERDIILASAPSKGHASGILAALDAGYTARAGIYLHPAESGNGLGDLKALAPGMLRFRIAVPAYRVNTNEPNHTLWVEQHDEPLRALLHLIESLRMFVARRNLDLDVPALNEMTGRSAQMLVSAIEAGDSISRAPDAIEAVVTLSVAPGESVFDLRAATEACLANAAASDRWLESRPPEITWLFGTSGVEIPRDHIFYRQLEQAVHVVTGNLPRYYAGHIASEIRQPMLKYGFPCIGLGPRSGGLSQAGKHDEWLDIPEFLQTVAICAGLAIAPLPGLA